MLPKKNRINKKDFDTIFKEGFVIHSPIFMFKYKKSLDNMGHFSFVAPKTVAKKAVTRNYLRRKGYNSLKNKDFPAIFGIFIYKKGVDTTVDKKAIDESIDIILSKIRT